MKTKISIILIILIGLGVGGFFVWKNISVPEEETAPEEEPSLEEKEKVIPQAYQLNVSRVFAGEVLKEKETEEGPGLCYLGAFAMLALFDDPDLDFTEIVAYSGIGVTAKNVVPFIGLTNDFQGNSIITGAENLGYNFGLGLLSGGKDSINHLPPPPPPPPPGTSPPPPPPPPPPAGSEPPTQFNFKESAKEVKYFSNKEEATRYLKSIISSDKPVLVHLDLYYVTDDFAKISPSWAWEKFHASHFMIVTGYDENYVYINDPDDPDLAIKNMPASYKNFLEAWENGANPQMEGHKLGPYWMLYLKDKAKRKSIKEIMAWNREISENAAFEIGEALNSFFLGEMAVGRLEFAKFLERNGYQNAANLYREAGNLYLKKPTIDELSLIAGKEEEARNSF
ncbi:hypothetical protein LCGC14_0102210 [marine sediment metagenome]|uniref:Peptidase C39-like domain-containing protein n=1 Tax=marine sediment metagenome TaxID=412755 RepID=A0A0F9XTH0_9ZZZZ|nr:hypothetical protein [Candidatus Nealsonbacteria bacterium]